MSGKVETLPIPFTTNIMVDAQAADVCIEVGPALIFDCPYTPGQIVPEDQPVGVSLNIQKGSALSILTIIENDKAVELVEALVTWIVRVDPRRRERAEALSERFMTAVTKGFDSPVY